MGHRFRDRRSLGRAATDSPARENWLAACFGQDALHLLALVALDLDTALVHRAAEIAALRTEGQLIPALV